MTRKLKLSTPEPLHLGPFISSANAITPLTGLDIQPANILLSKNGSELAATEATVNPAAVHDANGLYLFVPHENDLDEPGELFVSINMPGALPHWQTYEIATVENYNLQFVPEMSLGRILADVTVYDPVADKYKLLGAAIGAGSYAKKITVKSDTGTPISQAKVWVTTDLHGDNVIAGTLFTDDFGAVIFYLDSGVYYVWRDHPNFQFNNPAKIAVTGNDFD